MIAGMAASVGARLGVYDLDNVLGILGKLIEKYAARDGSTFDELARRRAEKLLG